jgi:hypothetical protein
MEAYLARVFFDYNLFVSAGLVRSPSVEGSWLQKEHVGTIVFLKDLCLALLFLERKRLKFLIFSRFFFSALLEFKVNFHFRIVVRKKFNID